MLTQSVGVIGLGRMGSGIANHLVDEGYTVLGYDVGERARAAARETGVEVFDSPAKVAARCDVVLTSLPTPDTVTAVYTASDGLLAADDPFVALEMSTSDPDTTVSLAERASQANVTLIDAPVSGGPEDAAEGTLTALVGGPNDVVTSDPVENLLDAVATTYHHVGDVGAGHTAKLVNNVMTMGNLLLAAEAVSLGVRRGIDGERLFDALTNAGGASNQFRKRLPRILNRNFEAGFTVAFGRKDLGLALDAARGSDHSMPTTGLVYQLYTRAVQEGYAEEDIGAVAKLVESRDATIDSVTPVDESFDGY